MKNFWLGATVLGTVIPYFFFYNQIVSEGFSWSEIFYLIFPTYAATGFIADLLLASFVFWIYIYKKAGKSLFLQVVLLNLTVGLSAALPYFLYRTTEKIGKKTQTE